MVYGHRSSLFIQAGCGGSPRVGLSELEQGVGWRFIGKAVHTQGQCTHTAEHTKGGMWPPLESCYLSGVRGWAPTSSEASCSKGVGWHFTSKAVHTQGGPHKRRSVATA